MKSNQDKHSQTTKNFNRKEQQENLKTMINNKLNSQVYVRGIHGKHLPYINDEPSISQKQYWKHQNKYVINPTHKS